MADNVNARRRASRILLVIGVVALIVTIAAAGLAARRAPPPLQLGTIPYRDGEAWQYRWLQGDRQVGWLTITVASGAWNARPAWVFTSEVRTGSDPTAEPVDVTRVYADATTLQAIHTETALAGQDGHYNIILDYSPRRVTYAAQTPRGPQSGSQALPGPTYDNDQLVMLLRALPLAQGYTAKLVCLQPRTVAIYRLTLKVEGQEEATVAGEKISCWRVSLTVNGRAQTAWYAVSPDHRMVRLEGPTGVFELQSPYVVPGTGTARASMTNGAPRT